MGLKAKEAYFGETRRPVGNRDSTLQGAHTESPGSRAQGRSSRLKGSWIRPTCWSHRGSERGQRRKDSLGTRTLSSHLWELFLPQGRWYWQCQGEVLPPGPCSTVVSLKTRNRTTIWPSNSTLGYISKKDRTLIWKDACTPVFIEALSTIAKVWNNWSVHQQRNGWGRCSV